MDGHEEPPPYTPIDPLTPSSSNVSTTTGDDLSIRAIVDNVPEYSPSVIPANFVSAAGYFYERPPPSAPRPDGEILEHALTIYNRSEPKDFSRFPRCWRIRADGISNHDWTTFLNYLFPAHLGLASRRTSLPAKLRAEIERDQKDRPQESDEERKSRIAAVVSEWNDCFFVPRGTAVIYRFGGEDGTASVSPLCPNCYPSTVRSIPVRQGSATSTAIQVDADQIRSTPADANLETTADTDPSAPAPDPQPQAAPKGPSFNLADAVNSIQNWANTIATYAQQYGERVGEQAEAHGRAIESRAEFFGRLAERQAQAKAEWIERQAKRFERAVDERSKSYSKSARDAWRTPTGGASWHRHYQHPYNPSYYGGPWGSHHHRPWHDHPHWQHWGRRNTDIPLTPRGRSSSVSSSASSDSSSSISSGDSASTISAGSDWNDDDLDILREGIRDLQERYERSRVLISQHHIDAAGLRRELVGLKRAHKELRKATRSRARRSRRRPGHPSRKLTKDERRALKEEARNVKQELRSVARQARSELKSIRRARKEQQKEERKAKKEAKRLAKKGKGKQCQHSGQGEQLALIIRQLQQNSS
jgi:hypothetical protein